MPEDWVETYKNQRPRYEKLTTVMKELLTNLLRQERIDFLSPLQSRTKSVESYQEKIIRKKYNNPIKETTDLTGLRVIVPYPDEIPLIKEVIEENFKIDRKNTIDKSAVLKKNQFAYGGINYVVSLSKEREQMIEYREFREMKFEIQLLTLCQYTWAEIQRKIEYKSEDFISPQISRRLARLVALFDLADSEFMAIRNEGINELRQCGITGMTMKQFVRVSPRLKTMIKTAIKGNFVDMSTAEDEKYLNELLEVCSFMEFKNIGSLENYLSDENKFSDLNKSLIANNNPSIRTGPITLCLIILYHSNKDISPQFLLERGWTEPVLTILLDR